MTKKKVQKKTISTSLKNKENLKLSIQFSLDGFSFCTSSVDSKENTYFSNYQFDNKNITPENLLQKIEEIFKNDIHLQNDFSSVFVVHENNLSTLVPNDFFDKEKLKDYLDFNIKTLATDYLTFDSIEALNVKNIYIPYININNYLFQNFGEFEYKHHLTVLIEKLIKNTSFLDQRMFVNASYKSIDIIVLRGKNLILSNSFSYETKEDFIYYILFVAEQLGLNPDEFQLMLLGNIEKESELFNMAFQYIRNISFLESSNPIFNNLEHSKHSNYILLG